MVRPVAKGSQHSASSLVTPSPKAVLLHTSVAFSTTSCLSFLKNLLSNKCFRQSLSWHFWLFLQTDRRLSGIVLAKAGQSVAFVFSSVVSVAEHSIWLFAASETWFWFQHLVHEKCEFHLVLKIDEHDANDKFVRHCNEWHMVWKQTRHHPFFFAKSNCQFFTFTICWLCAIQNSSCLWTNNWQKLYSALNSVSSTVQMTPSVTWRFPRRFVLIKNPSGFSIFLLNFVAFTIVVPIGDFCASSIFDILSFYLLFFSSLQNRYLVTKSDNIYAIRITGSRDNVLGVSGSNWVDISQHRQ